LPFLPQAARDLYAVMTDPERGACVSALGGGGLLIDPTVAKAKKAIDTAYLRAARDGATLFIGFIGHEPLGKDFFLMPRDATPHPLNLDTAVHLVDVIKYARGNAKGQVDGLGVLVDAYFAGLAGFGAAEVWVAALDGTLRFEMLTAAAKGPAWNGCFSRRLVELLRQGAETVSSGYLQCADLRP
jgi:hypothetical protein